MQGLKKVLITLFSLAGILSILVFTLSWYGPYTSEFSHLLAHVIPADVALGFIGVTLVGFVVLLLITLSSRKITTIELVKLNGGKITVAKGAIASQAKLLVEQSMWCHVQHVQVRVRNKHRVDIFIKVQPDYEQDLSHHGQALYDQVYEGMSNICGSALHRLEIRFTSIRQTSVPQHEYTDHEYTDHAATLNADTLDNQYISSDISIQSIKSADMITNSLESAQDCSTVSTQVNQELPDQHIGDIRLNMSANGSSYLSANQRKES